MTKEELRQIPFYIEDISGSENTVSISNGREAGYDETIVLSYSYDLNEWYVKYISNRETLTLTIPSNNKIYFEAEGWNNTWYTQVTINCSGDYNVGGNILSLEWGVADEYMGASSFKREGVFQRMFENSTTLINAKDLILPYFTIRNCYSSMFNGCTNLITAPELPATELSPGCYEYMFSQCKLINYIKADFIKTESDEYDEFGSNVCLTNWVSGVSTTGTFVMNPNATYNPEEIRGSDGIPIGWTVRTTVPETLSYCYITTDVENTLVVQYTNNVNLEYNFGDDNWVSITSNMEIPFNEMIILRGNNTSLDGVRIKTSKESTLNGNIMALLYGDDYEGKTTFPEGSKNTFKYLFLGYDKLISISNLQLPVTTLVPHCYQHMFTGCTKLQTITELPAIDLTDFCYHGMFMDCDSIDKVSLPEAYLAPYAYSNMFLGSDNLSDVTVTYKDDVDETNYKGWLDGVSANGKFKYVNDSEVEENTIRNSYNVPGSWDIENYGV